MTDAPDPAAGPATDAPPSGADAPGRPTCVCGYDRHHLMVSAEPKYGGWRGFWVIFMGVSAVPLRVDYRCRVCQQVFDSTDDPGALNRTM